MEIPVDMALEPKKNWIAPDLTKIDIDEITAGTSNPGNDMLVGGS